ncbi:MAG: acetylglutamate kinase [Succinivibrio sp.]|nr:acetylglutamate kinase [Succinivibrio sp.]
MNDITVLKLSGKALTGTEELSSVFRSAHGHKLVIVHGGGVEVDALFEALHLEVKKKNGLRVSPREQMPYISAALSGMCGKSLQSMALKSGLKALSILASDGNALSVSCLDEELGMVGAVKPCSSDYLNLLLDNGYTPVIASLAFDEKGNLFNVNADDVAEAVAVLLNAPLYLISDVKGVLDKDGQLIESLDEAEALRLIADGTITEGMAVKVKSALRAAAKIRQNVYIASYKDPLLSENLMSRRHLGTSFRGF